METRRFDKKDVKEVAELLKNGQVVAFPTDTVFGLGVIYENESICSSSQASVEESITGIGPLIA